MKKLVFAVWIVVLASRLLHADLVREEVPVVPGAPAKHIVWLRDGVKIMTQTPANSLGVSICQIGPFTQGAALTIWFKNGKIACMFSGPALNGHLFSIDNFTKDGVPDFIQITGQKVENHLCKLVEAYSIVNGIVEPLPDKLFKRDHTEFYFDDEIVAYLKEKKGEASREAASKASTLTGQNDSAFKGLTQAAVEARLKGEGFEFSFDAKSRMIHAILNGEPDALGIFKSRVLEVVFGADGRAESVSEKEVFTGP